jgi:hypothetical protein
MSLPQLILWIAAIAVGFSSVWRNPTALALVLAFAASEAGLPPKYFMFPDIFTLAMIFAKPRYQPCPAYWMLTTWGQLKCIVAERSPSDRFVMFSLPMAWAFYAPVLSHQQYWALWWVATAQFLVVGLEPVLPFIRRRFAAVSHQSRTSNGLEAAIA